MAKLTDTTASAKFTLRNLARRWLALNVEIAEADRHLNHLTTNVAPSMRHRLVLRISRTRLVLRPGRWLT